ncbi:MAG: aldo/keto reductase [Bacteroidetes bacterium]|jgi:aryl-alcohol dehydrogenase-like predicted oxidoreductase|nr:aldo/keto reductase [Bacteroidota bacterium]
MEYRSFGSTSLTISSIGFGAWAIGGPVMAGEMPIGWGDADDATSVDALRRALDRGITFYDTADFYGLGHSEELLGAVFGNSDRVVIASKVGHRLINDGTIALDYSKKHILSACEQSLRRLKRDAIDFYQLHSARMQHFEQGECITAMEQLRQEGKIRFWGLSLNTFAPEAEAEFLMSHHLADGFQLVLNIINQRALNVIAKAREKGYGIIARMPLQFGLLTGAITPERTFGPNDHRSFRLTPVIIQRTLDALQTLEPMRHRLGITQTSLALSYCVNEEGVSTVIPGIRTPEQAVQNTTEIIPLSSEDMKQIRDLYATQLHEIVALMQKQG